MLNFIINIIYNKKKLVEIILFIIFIHFNKINYYHKIVEIINKLILYISTKLINKINMLKYIINCI